MRDKQNELLWHAANDLLECLKEDLQKKDEVHFTHEFQVRMTNLDNILQGEDPVICPKCYHGLKEKICDLMDHQ